MFKFSSILNNQCTLDIENIKPTIPSKLHSIESTSINHLDFDIHQFSSINFSIYKRKLTNSISKNIGDGNITTDSDVVKGVYEGGLKVWECSYDLIEYLSCNKHLFQDKSIIDIGCGQGLVGIYCLLNGAKFVAFQDYNEEVLKLMTLPNVLINYKKCFNKDIDMTNPPFCLISGDWCDPNLNQLTPKTDLIVTSETIYSSDTIPHLIRYIRSIFANKHCDDKICLGLVAAKRFYFGVGGSTDEFINQYGSEVCDKAKIYEDKSSNIREIVAIYNK